MLILLSLIIVILIVSIYLLYYKKKGKPETFCNRTGISQMRCPNLYNTTALYEGGIETENSIENKPKQWYSIMPYDQFI